MDSTSTYALRRADDLIRSGKTEYALTILLEYLRQNPKSEQGWLLLSLAMKDRQKQMDSLRMVLRINPNNVIARSRLAQLKLETESLTTSLQRESEKSATGRTVPLMPPEPPEISDLESKTTQPAYNLFPGEQPSQTRRPFPFSILRQIKPFEILPSEPVRPGQSSSPILNTVERISQKIRRNPELLTLIVGAGLVMLIVLVTLITMAGLKNYREVSAYNTQVVFQTTHQAQLVALPIWTSTPISASTLTPTATPTVPPTPTATLPAPALTTAAQMRHIQQQVAEIRGLDIIDEVDPYLVNQNVAQQVLTNDLIDQGYDKELLDEARVLTALGLIDPTYDLTTYVLNGMIDHIGGVYIPWRKQIFILEQQFAGIGQFIYAHEYDHALLAQNFHVDEMGVYPYCLNDAQGCNAIRALIEGDASLLMSQWLQTHATPSQIQDIQKIQPATHAIPDQYPPPFVGKDLSFPSVYGARFVQYLYDRGKWDRVDKAYTELPESTEQIIHPEKYLRKEAPVAVADPALNEVLSADWRELHSDVLGEWLTYMILGYGADLAAQQGDEVAAEAAAGWGGDYYQAYATERANEIVLSVHWLWDSQTDTEEFNRAMIDYLHKRFRGNKLNRDGGNCWQSTGQTSCLFEKGSHTLWIIAPEEGLIDQIVQLYTNFTSP